MLGLRYGTVKLVPHSLEWANAFREERARLTEALSEVRCEIEHVGSTAVPELCAKPILDIIIGVTVAIPIESVISAIQGVGYQYRGDARDAGGHIFVRESDVQVRTHHVHVVELYGPQWHAYLLLRDFLRTNREARRVYVAEKQMLAERHSADRKAYTAAKDNVVRRLLAEAGRLRA
jgi:GrpB-like predicted nucleotidyltransferase (UPF0157 family)